MQFGHFKREFIVVKDIGFVQFIEITVWQKKKETELLWNRSR